MPGSILDAAELIQQNHTRTFYQPGGPSQPRYFFGIGSQYHFIDGAEMPTNGDVEPIYVPDPRNAKRWRLVGRTEGTPELPTLSAVFHEKWGGIPRHLMNLKCETNFYEVHGLCADLSDFYRGWDAGGYMMIYSGFLPTGNIDLGTRTSREDDDPMEDGLEFTGAAIYPVGALGFGEEAAQEVPSEVIDVVYGAQVTCGNCGPVNDGSNYIYALTRANIGSPSQPGQVVYSTNGGATWATAQITGIGTSAEPRYIDIVGNMLIVGTDSTSLFYTVLNADTAAPTTWTAVTLPVAMRDVYVQSSSAIYFAADAGRVYRTSDITIAPSLLANGAGADNLMRITGSENVIVAVGAAGRVYKSINNGVTWASTTAPVAAILQAVAIGDTKGRLLFVGSAAGNLYRSTNGGTTWETVSIPNGGAGAINDIIAVTREVLWIAQTVSNGAYLSTTLDGGLSWTASNAGTSRIQNWPTFQRVNRLAAPVAGEPGVAANYLAVGGLQSASFDGLLLVGAPSVI